MKTSSIFNFSRAPLGLVAALSVVFVLEVFQVLFAPYFHLEEDTEENREKLSRYGLLRVETKHRISLSGDMPVDIVVVGDSQGMVGVSPAAIAAVSPYRTMNYSGYASDGTIGGYIMLRNHLRTNSTSPKVLVICFSDLTFQRRTPRDGYEFQYARGDRETLMADIGLGAWIRAQFPSVRHHATLKKMLGDPSLLRHIDLRAVRAIVDETYDARGYVAYTRVLSYRTHPPTEIDVGSLTRPIEVSPHIEKYFRSVIETGFELGLRVLLVRGVRPQEWYDYDANSVETKNIHALYRSFKQDYPEIVFLDVQSIVGDPSNFVDRYHMNPTGARLLSEYIAATIMSLGA